MLRLRFLFPGMVAWEHTWGGGSQATGKHREACQQASHLHWGCQVHGEGMRAGGACGGEGYRRKALGRGLSWS